MEDEFYMEAESKKYAVRDVLNSIEKRPAIYIATKEKRLDYACHFIDGWLFGNKEPIINYKYHMGITQWICDWILKNKHVDVSHLQYRGHKYIMIYEVTEGEDEAWELFFKISYEYLDYLESKDKIES